jgi:hypothetical protein
MGSLLRVGSAATVASAPLVAPAKAASKTQSKVSTKVSTISPKQSCGSWLIDKIKKIFTTIFYYLTCGYCCKKEQIQENPKLAVKKHSNAQEKPKVLKTIDFSRDGLDRDREVRDGYGELILRVKEGNQFRPASQEECAKAYKIFQKHVPKLDGKKPDASRIELIRRELGEIHPHLVGTFIPRTLFDLIFIRASIAEDLEKARVFPFKNPQAPSEDELNDLRHRCYPSENSWCKTTKPYKGIEIPSVLKFQLLSDVASQNDRLLFLATRLNALACQVIGASGGEHLSLGQIEGLVEEQIRFLKEMQKHPRAKDIPNCGEPGPSSNFLNTHSFRGGMRPMAVNTQKAEQIIKNASLLECLPSSIGKVILYRGADFSKDSPERSGPNSLSFGMSLFAGVVNDGGATAYSYMRDENLDAYAVPVDLNKANSDLFYLPSLTALESLFGHGESFHARSKAYLDPKNTRIGGFLGSEGLQKEAMDRLFRSSLPKEAFLERYHLQEKFAVSRN